MSDEIVVRVSREHAEELARWLEDHEDTNYGPRRAIRDLREEIEDALRGHPNV